MPNVITINDVVLPVPDTMTVILNKIWSKNAGRTAAGYMVGDIVSRKYKLEIGWGLLDEVQVQTITANVDTDAFFSCVFLDPYTNATKKIEAYAGDISLPIKQYVGNKVLYKDLKVSLIER